MAINTKGLCRDFEGKVIRVYFKGGEIAEVKLWSFDLHENCQFGDSYAGIVYDLIQTNRPDCRKTDTKSGAFWADLTEIDKCEPVD